MPKDLVTPKRKQHTQHSEFGIPELHLCREGLIKYPKGEYAQPSCVGVTKLLASYLVTRK
jgi:hypothetical protein